MSLPYFFIDKFPTNIQAIELDEDASRHIQVLRMREGEKLKVTNGIGQTAEGTITSSHKKHSIVQIDSFQSVEQPVPRLTIAISLVKNATRFEWFLEKATELGTAEIIPVLCERTERQKFRHDRMIGICKSAMLQSLQAWLPVLHEPKSVDDVIQNANYQQKMIAHCANDHRHSFSSLFDSALDSHIILIGPEGDFSHREILLAKEMNFLPVSLGSTRLRTETAAVFAAAWASGARNRQA